MARGSCGDSAAARVQVGWRCDGDQRAGGCDGRAGGLLAAVNKN